MKINNSKSNLFRVCRSLAIHSAAEYWTRFPWFCVLLVSCSMTAIVRAEDPPKGPISVRPEVQNADWAVSWWMPRHEEKLKEKSKLKDCRLVWIGDSITHGWEGDGKDIWNDRYAKYDALNLGFSGDRTEHVLWRLQHGAVESLHPKLIVIMIGTNNAGHRQEPSEETAAGVKAIVEDLRQRLPDAKILLLGVFPRGDTNEDPMRQLNIKTNEIISKLADGEKIVFLDIGAKFLDADGNLPAEIMPDKLHPNRKGYEVWAQAIDEKLTDLLK